MFLILLTNMQSKTLNLTNPKNPEFSTVTLKAVFQVYLDADSAVKSLSVPFLYAGEFGQVTEADFSEGEVTLANFKAKVEAKVIEKCSV